VERLETRCLLDAGAAATVLAPPSTFASEAEFRQYLIDAAVAQWSSVLGTSFPASGYYGIWAGTPTPMPVAMSVAIATSAAAPSHSETNNQVQGVDEGDIVENDGNALYILSGSDLKIVDARNPAALTVASSTAIDGQPIAEYLNGTRLTIISSSDRYFTPGQTDTIPGFGFGWGLGGVIRPPILLPQPVVAPVPAGVMDVAPGALVSGAPGDWVPTSPLVKITELDVSDLTAPSVLRQTTLDGMYVNSRAVGDQVYVILQNNLPVLPAPETHVEGNQIVYETADEYRARLASLVSDITLPQFSSQAAGQADASGDQVAINAIYKPEAPGEQSLFTVLSFDATKPAAGPAASVGVVASSAATVYATPEHLDLFSPQWPAFDASAPAEATTLIRQFTLDGDNVTLTAVGSVPGTVLNQYSVDEQGPYLRVATTETTAAYGPIVGTTDAPAESNSIYVLAEENGVLSVVGSLKGLAPGERIYATRFFGDRAYVVTFQQFDPLFAIDLSDPTAPKLAGSLELPGFSRYLQPIDATHLIGIGQQVANGEPSNVQVSLFDVSDLAHPRRVDVTTVSTGDSYWMTTSEHYDAHQVFYDAGTQTLAIPINGYSASGGATDPGTLQDALWVFHVDPDNGLTQLGHIDATRPVERAERIGDVLFSISQDAVKAVPIGDPATILGQVQIRDPNDIPPSWGWGGVLWPIDRVIAFVPVTPNPTPNSPAAGDPPGDHPGSPSGTGGNAAPTVEILGQATLFQKLVSSGALKATGGHHHHPGGPSRFHGHGGGHGAHHSSHFTARA
jgi:uncharacterized secreted protein with C-terminal beta-propeller domain